jgi:hypothetical protein
MAFSQVLGTLGIGGILLALPRWMVLTWWSLTRIKLGE